MINPSDELCLLLQPRFPRISCLICRFCYLSRAGPNMSAPQPRLRKLTTLYWNPAKVSTIQIPCQHERKSSWNFRLNSLSFYYNYLPKHLCRTYLKLQRLDVDWKEVSDTRRACKERETVCLLIRRRRRRSLRVCRLAETGWRQATCVKVFDFGEGGTSDSHSLTR